MKGSGKQMLLAVLRELSLRKMSEDELASATRRIRAALLVHGSTADESFLNVSRLSWASDGDDDSVERQGLATAKGQVLVSDVFERILEMPDLESFLKSSFEGATRDDIDAALWGIWAIVSASQMFAQLLSVETEDDSELDVDGWVDSMTQKYDHFFRRIRQ